MLNHASGTSEILESLPNARNERTLELKQNHAVLFARRRRTLAFGNKVAKNVAGDIGRLLSPQGARSEGMVPPLSPKIENFRGPHRKITLSCKSVEQATQREPLVSAALFCIFFVERNSRVRQQGRKE